MYGGICLIAVIVEFPYRIYQGTEFSLSAKSVVFYLIFSSFYATYQVYKTKKAIFDQSAEPS
ncbi:MAG: hypothetical protein EA359_18900 [Balneolaceae bacterium]|nr:MAG: hypothetical protein EA359_18900 [Balneolaceae bacterium]